MQDDYDDRRDRGGRHRGGNNRKRRFEDDEDDYADRRGPPVPQRRRRDDYGPRRRYEEPPLAKLRRMLINIASSTKLPEEEAIEIAECLGEQFDDGELRSEFFKVYVQLIIEQPLKIPFAAAVALYGHHIKSEIAVEAVKHVAEKAQQSLDAGHWKNFKLLLRFFACLQALFEDDGVFALLRQLFDTVVDLQSNNENDVVGIELVKIILLTIPYTLVAGGERFYEQARDLLQNTGIVASNMIPIEGYIAAYVDDDEAPFSYHSVIGLLQAQLQTAAESGWGLECIPRFHLDALGEKAAAQAIPMLAFPQFTIGNPVSLGPVAIFPEAFFSLYADTEIETVPRRTDIAGSLIRDAIVDTIDQLDFNREAASKLLIDLDCYWSISTFAKRGTAFDKLREQPGDKMFWKSEDMVIDAIFSQLFKLPEPEHKLIYYHSLITQACKIAPAAIAPSLGRAIRFLYRNLDIMDLELANRFLDWFSHHLSNFEFRWRWAEWIDDLDLSDLQPKKAFIRAAIDREIRLSFAKRIRSTLPEEYHVLIPPALDQDIPSFKYDDALTPYAAEAKTLLQQFRRKDSDEVLTETIDKIHKLASEQGIEDILVPSTDAFVTVLCRVGAKSMSHFLSCIDRSRPRLMDIATRSEAARRQIVASVTEFWNNQPGVAVNIVDKLMNYGILQPSTVLQWALEDRMGAGQALAEGWIYEMVSKTMQKVSRNNRAIAVQRLSKNLKADQVAMTDEALLNGRRSVQELFRYIEDTLRGLAEGVSDNMMETEADGSLSDEDRQLIKAWAGRWLTTFLRKAKVEEAVVGEEAMSAKLKLADAERAASAAAGDAAGATGSENPIISTAQVTNGSAQDINGNGVAKTGDDML